MMGSCSAWAIRRFSVLFALAAAMSLLVPAASAEDFDWRNINGQNWVTSVKDQFGGTCWDFAACGVLEAKYMLTRNDNTYRPNVSEQQVCWEGFMGNSESGGRVDEALDYFTSHGVVLDSECPNDPSDPDHWDDPAPDDPWPLATGWENRVFKSTSNSNYLAEGTNTAYIKNCLKKYGPLSLRMEADNDFYIPDPGSYRGGHVVVIVGFHDDASVPGGGYWIIKNSWGTGWNWNGPGTIQDGYGAIAYATQPSYEDPWFSRNRDVCGINGLVYYTGSMATVTWKGGLVTTWSSGGNNWEGVDQYGTALPTYAWQNRETTAIFDAAATAEINLSGTVIAHGLTIETGATGYVFNGVSNGAFTVTGGGITANEDVTINAPVTIGAPQTWTVATGKKLDIGGDLHTIISGLTITGTADTVVRGSIDGGGVLNTMGVTPGKITLKNGAYLWLDGAADYSVDIDAQSSSHGICFDQPSGVVGNCYGKISGGGYIDKRDKGTIILHNADNNYTNLTSIYNGGAVQADSGDGLPAASLLNLNGGVLQSNSTVTFTRSLGTSGDNKFQWNTAGGGFAGGAGPMTVRIGGSASTTVVWGTTVGTNLVGTLRFGSSTAANTVTFENPIDLTALERTIYVEDNPNTDADLAIISGVITDSSGNWTGGIRKTGPGTLVLTGENENGVGDGSDGNTTIVAGALQADRNVGLSDWAGLILDGGVLQSNSAITYAEPLWANGSGGQRVKWISGGFSAGGGKMTVNIGGAGTPETISFGGSDGTAAIAGTLKLSSNTAHYETELRNGLNINSGDRTIQVDDNPHDTGDFATLSGVISGAGTWTKTGQGTLYLSGSSGNTFTGTTRVEAGQLRLNKTSGSAVAGNLELAGSGADDSRVYLDRSNQIANSAVVNFVNDESHTSRLNLFGHTDTVAGVTCTDGRGVIQNTEDESGISTNGALTVSGSGTYSYNGYLRDRDQGSSTGKVAFVKSGTGTQILAGANIMHTGGTTVSSGTLVLQDTTNSTFLATNMAANGSGTLEFNTAAGNLVHSGVISGSGSLKKTGSFGLTLGGASANLLSGTTTVAEGVLYLDKSSGAAISGNLNIAGTTTNAYVYTYRDEQIADTSLVSFSNTTSYSRLYLDGHTETVGGISCTDGRGLIQDGTLIVNNSTDCFYNGYMRNYGSTSLALQKYGSGTLTLSGSSIYYYAGTTVHYGKLVLQDTTNATYCSSNITNHGTLAFDTVTTDVKYTGAISGIGSLHKTGSKKLTLTSASNSYSGVTAVYDGVLSATSTAVPGALTILSGGAFAPGDGVGSATTGTAACYEGGRYLFEIDDADGIAGIDWDLWNVNGNMSILPSFTVEVTTLNGLTAGAMADFDYEQTYSWLLAETTGLIYGFENLLLDASGFANALDPAGYLQLTTSTDSRQLFLSYSISVPGDSNHDNRVDETDAAALAAHWGLSGGWEDGDFNDDGIVNAADAAILAANWGDHGYTESGGTPLPNPVPEPGALALLAMGLLALLTKRRA